MEEDGPATFGYPGRIAMLRIGVGQRSFRHPLGVTMTLSTSRASGLSRPFGAAALLLLAGACGGNSVPYQAQQPYATAPSQPRPVVVQPGPTATAPHTTWSPTPGAFLWAPTLNDAQNDARRTNRLVFLEAGRPNCGNCQALKNKVIPDPQVSGSLGAVSVGFYDDIDSHPNSAAVRVL
jgi:hypothetical protein